MSEVITGPHWTDYVKIDDNWNRYIPDDAPQWAKDSFEEDKKSGIQSGSGRT